MITSPPLETAYDTAELSLNIINRMTSIMEGDDSPDGILSGYPNLDKVLCGFRKENLYIIGSRPMGGKTSFAINLVCNMSMRHQGPKNVVIFSPESSANMLMQRILSCISGVPIEKIARGKVEEKEWQILKDILYQKIPAAPLIIDENPVLTIEYMTESLTLLKQENKVDIVFIDHLQLMSAERMRYRDEEIAEIMKGLKRLSKKFAIPIVVLCDIKSSQKPSTKDYSLKLSDLRPSGVIEAEADVILFLYPNMYSFNGRNKAEKDSEILVRIGKNRMGPLETFLFRSEFPIQKISEYTGLF